MNAKQRLRIFAIPLLMGLLLHPLYGGTTLTPGAISGNQGDVAQVGVYFTTDDPVDLNSTIVGAQFVLEYDPAILEPGGIQQGSALVDHEVFDEQDDDTGQITVTVLSMKNSALGAGDLVTVSFTLLADVDENSTVLDIPKENTLLVTKGGDTESYEEIQRISELFFSSTTSLDAAKLAVGRAITMTADSNGTEITYAWDFGDGNVTTGSEVSHTYSTPNSYLVTLTATNYLSSQIFTSTVVVKGAYWDLDATDEGNGWKSFDWFGYYYEADNSWIYHENLGWLYRSGETADDTWFWSERWEWTWTSSEVWPYLRQEDADWLFYFKGSSDPAWFYHYGADGSGAWEY